MAPSSQAQPQVALHQQKQHDDLRLLNACFLSAPPFSPLTNCIPVLRIYKLTSALDTTQDVLKTGAENKCLSLLQEQTAIFVKVLWQNWSLLRICRWADLAVTS